MDAVTRTLQRKRGITMFDADKYWKNKAKPCPYAEGNMCFLILEPDDEKCKGCRWFETYKKEKAESEEV